MPARLPHGMSARDYMYLETARFLKGAAASYTTTERAKLWEPDPNNWPQQMAYACEADELFYGGAAGGGKSDLILGLAIEAAHRAVIFRREYKQLSALIDRCKEIIGTVRGWNGSDRHYILPGGQKIEFGACQLDSDMENWQGRPHDTKLFDELPQFAKRQYQYLSGWTRTTRPGQRTRVVATGNPPSTPDGNWVIEYWGPWLSDRHPNPALPGELRWFVCVRDTDVELVPRFWYVAEDGQRVWAEEEQLVVEINRKPRVVVNGQQLTCFPGECRIDEATRRVTEWRIPPAERGEQRLEQDVYLPSSRTFIPARLTDNRFIDMAYRAKIDAMPEPLRTQLLMGDFAAGTRDDAWQVIPSAWVDAAMDRWRRRTIELGEQSRPPSTWAQLDQLGIDVARGGTDRGVLFKRHGDWLAWPQVREGSEVRNGTIFAAWVAVELAAHPEHEPVLMVDLTGVGTSPYDQLVNTYGEDRVQAFVASARTNPNARDRSGKLAFKNDRAQALWHMRELLDPEHGEEIMLPPVAALRADLCAARYTVVSGRVVVEPKEDIIERIGRSPDYGDACVLAFWDGALPVLRF